MFATKAIIKSRRLYYTLINRLVFYRKLRWTFTFILILTYVQTAQASYDIASYLIGFYLLQLLIGYFTPRGIDDEEKQQNNQLYSFTDQISQDMDWHEGKIELQHDEDKPLTRSLNEIEIWERATFAFLMGLVCTYSKMVQVEVFWPLLLLYFLVLASYTVQKILKTMKKYKYGVVDFHKQPR